MLIAICDDNKQEREGCKCKLELGGEKMYSWEITQIMKHYEYNLPSNVYLAITKNSPQINKVTYDACGGRFEMCDNEGGCWCFNVYYAAA